MDASTAHNAYLHVVPSGKPKFGKKLTFKILAGCNSEAIQHIIVKLTLGECLKRHYVRTKCVDLTWNDP